MSAFGVLSHIATLVIFIFNKNLLKQNKDNYYNEEIRRQNLINSYERKINELEDTIDNYIKNEYSYQDKIINLENEISMYKNNN